MSNTIERIRKIMHRDDACEVGNLVPSDLRELVGEIERLERQMVNENRRANAAEAEIARRDDFAFGGCSAGDCNHHHQGECVDAMGEQIAELQSRIAKALEWANLSLSGTDENEGDFKDSMALIVTALAPQMEE